MNRTLTRRLRRPLTTLALLASGFLWAGDTTLLTGPGFGPFRRLPGTWYGSLELNHTFSGSPIGGWLSADVTGDGRFLGLGPLVPFRMGNRWTGAVSTGPGWYSNDPGLNLGSRMEFRSTAYLQYQAFAEWRLSLALSHYSNGGIARHNPGAETLRLLLVIPIRRRN